MSLQLILGAAGCGKSHYIYNKIINESMDNPDTNYIFLVPEQYSMVLQKKMVMLHPNGGTMNIDVIGFNRLAYRIFDELGIKTAKVLEDFGKSMLIRQVAGTVRDELKIYGNSLDKPGFIDEVKSLMSELYQYDLGHGKINDILKQLKSKNEEDTLLGRKLADISVVFDGFLKKLGDEYIVAEDITELLADCIGSSKLIKNSVVVMDGFTGFTPIQYKVIEKLICNAVKTYGVFTIDKIFYNRKQIKPHELFYLTGQTIDKLKKCAIKYNVETDEDIFIDGSGYGRNDELCWLEKNLFRYPYKKYGKPPKNISITSYVSLRQEISGVALNIRRLVMCEGYRYRDFAIVTGNFEETEEIVRQVMPKYGIPVFSDYSRPVKNNPYVDAICHMLRAVYKDFSYDAVFAFIKSGVVCELSTEDIELMENYVLAHGIKGLWRWQRKWGEELDFAREYILLLAQGFIKGKGQFIKRASVKEFTNIVLDFMEKLDYENRLNEMSEKFLAEGDIEMSKLYGLLHGRICDLLEKMVQIMGDDVIDIDDFEKLVLLGLKDLSLGIIPTSLDMVTVGDITRTRLDDVKVLFILDANDGILSAKASPTQIISDREKERLMELGFELADTEKQRTYVEQFYLYINMTKPKDKLYISYITSNSDNETMRPSYIVGRISNIFPELKVSAYDDTIDIYGTRESSVGILTDGLRRLISGEEKPSEALYGLYRLYYEAGEEKLLDTIKAGLAYNNLPPRLAGDVKQLIKLKLMSVSVSRLEQYANCAYGYFLKYILDLKERPVNELDYRSIGTILHSAMERLYRYVYDNLENDWEKLEIAKRDKLIEQFVETGLENEFSEEDGKYEYMKSVLIRIVRRAADALMNITSGDLLKPEFFEYNFNKNIDENVTLTGVVDRADIYYNQEEKQLKLRIIDYKSGDYEFKINELYEGLQLQLSVYMNAMLEFVEKLYGKKSSEKINIIPEGMYYFQLHDPFVDVSAEEKLEAERNKKITLKGVCDNPEYIKNVSEFAIKKSKELAKDMLAGKIDKRPMFKGDKTSCTYCPYKAVCRFDDKNGKNSYRYRKYREKDREAVYKKILEELGGETDGMD